jgi:hypothetical protein
MLDDDTGVSPRPAPSRHGQPGDENGRRGLIAAPKRAGARRYRA